MHRLTLAVACLLAAGCASPFTGSSPMAGGAAPLSTLGALGSWSPSWSLDDDDEAESDEGHGVGHAILFWLPNRIFDVFDIVRARVKLGPGIGFTVRATELADVKLGTWTTVWVGLHGPRLEPKIPWPVGLESYSGAGISFAEAETEDKLYGAAEVGLGVHLLLVGVDVGVDVFELCDFVTGLIFIDLIDDDL